MRSCIETKGGSGKSRGTHEEAIAKVQARMMKVRVKMTVKLCLDSRSTLKLESIGFAYGLLVARGEKEINDDSKD